MIHLPENGTLYHGGYMEVRHIDLSKCRKGLDFGRGFYLTSSRLQANSYIPSAINKAQRRGIIPERYRLTDGRVSVYQFHSNPSLFIHCFEEADVEWLHFVACNRSQQLFPELRRKYGTVDIIGGKVADDFTAMTLNNYINGAYGTPGTEQADHMAIELLEPDRLKDQFCFRTEDAISCLEFIRSDRYEGR